MSFDINNYKVVDSLCDEDGYVHDKITGKIYECDSCPEVWEKVHKVMHRNSKLKEIFGNFSETKCENNRILALAPNNNNNFVRYAIGGDTDFNMEFKTKNEFEEYIETHNIKDKIKNEIQTMYEHKYCYENFSLLLTTGGSGSFQLIKGFKPKNGKGVCEKFDRADNVCMFILYLYNEFYKYKKCSKQRSVDNDIFNDITKRYGNEWFVKAREIMCSYLNKFEDIYDYCKEIYKIYDRSLVDKILDFAEYDYKGDYNTGIIDFIEIIKEMWECKRKFLEENK